MQLPVDVRAVIDEALDIDQARTTPLSVSVYLDESAPGDVQAHVRQAFASASTHARVTMSYVGAAPLDAFPGDDMAVIVAGLLGQIGAHAAELRAAGVPTMVVTTMPDLVRDIAHAQHHPIPEGDLVYPRLKNPARTLAAGKDGDTVEEGALAGWSVSDEPLPLDDASSAALNTRMGEWVVETCKDKRLAFALAFPFVRRPLSLDAVRTTALQNAGVGLVVIIPGADMPVMTLNQAKMLLMIAAAYDEPLGIDRAKELAVLVGGGFACRAVARQLVAFVPALGWAVKAAIGYTGTLAMGHAAIDYYEDGASAGKLTDAVAAARDKVVRFAGRKVAAGAQTAGSRVCAGVCGCVANAASNIKAVARGGSATRQ